MARVLVCGGRDFTQSAELYRYLDILHQRDEIDVVIEGDARGADRMAGYWAQTRHITNLKFAIEQEDWDKYGKGAGHRRNTRMLVEGKPDLVIAFPGGRGTANMVRQAKEAGVEVIEVEVAE